MKAINCQKCGYSGDVPMSSSNCPLCKSEKIDCVLSVDDSFTFSESLKGKAKENGVKKPIREFKFGDDYNYSRQKMVDRTMIIDRKENKYYEQVVDKETGEIIHECDEDLDKHYGHGNAKPKK